MKILLYLMTICVILVTSLLVKSYDVDNFLVIRSINTHYETIDGGTSSIELYASQISNQLLSTEIDRVKLSNDTLSFDVAVDSMEQTHQETYQSRTYFVYKLSIQLPYFYSDIFMDNVIIEITTLDSFHDIQIGNLNIIVFDSNHAHDWSAISGRRHETLMTLESIIVETKASLNVYLSPHITYEVQKHEDFIEILILNHQNIILKPILFIQSDEGLEMIIGIQYISSKRMLEQTEGYHHVYALY